jgi:alkylation response protein AidB-like acyl-CoA dehydrogenase
MSDTGPQLRDEIRAATRELLGDLPAAEPGDPSTGPLAWQQLAESGWLGLEIPEPLDGAGASFAEVAVVLEELGRAAASTPYLGTVGLSARALALVEQSAARDDLLCRIATGRTRVALALPADEDTRIPFRLEGGGATTLLTGQLDFVADADGADGLLVLALDPFGTPVVVNIDSPGEVLRPLPVLDETRAPAALVADSVPVRADSIWHFSADPAASSESLRRRAAVAIACDSQGIAELMLERTVAYAKVRRQFGREIGSFQAVKHACADMLVTVTMGRRLLDAAIDAVTTNEPAADIAVAMAKSHICAGAVDVAGTAVQLHGGIGYTWESGLHRYLKRALLNRSLFGSPVGYRQWLAQRLA